jgi:hypothetical protein
MLYKNGCGRDSLFLLLAQIKMVSWFWNISGISGHGDFGFVFESLIRDAPVSPRNYMPLVYSLSCGYG